MSILDVKIIDLKKNILDNNKLIVFEKNISIPFISKRSFVVTKTKGIRGEHAHHKCKQFMICLNGKIEIKYTDSFKNKKIILDELSKGIYIPPMIWCSQRYFTKNSVLLVFCNRYYEKRDYIRDYNEYKKTIKRLND
jgi:UDP-2-acetamido-3-amino-2,3-dideoxy-glucuronate N-acetyltransferase